MSTRYDAILFDLFGTLIDNFADEPFRACLTEMASALGVDAGQFIALWTDASMIHTRMSGAAACFDEYLVLFSAYFAVDFAPAQIARARDIRTAYTRHSLTPREGTIETLTWLRDEGYRLGLIANCTWEVPELWDATPFAPLFAHSVFSCNAGMMKPDQRIYLKTCHTLGVLPEGCLYIADGSDHELAGARHIGMDTILICAPHERDIVMQRPEPRQWTGPVIARIEELLAYLVMETERAS